MAILQLKALAPHDAEIRQRLTRNYRYTVDLIQATIEEGIERDTFHSVDPEATATFFVAAIDGARSTDLTLDTTTVRETTMDGIEHVVSELLVASADSGGC
ncbi:TetR family transcriptional regulator C-terminal domain-containing protein [Haladaptatus pallidirubidus]|uniref:TetR family transcriptional regulator C-terminal domain-containing protein n=1 Tax=Haladaptatus pallidirubidus TaxID=1008152 RepID=UPI0035EEBF89